MNGSSAAKHRPDGSPLSRLYAERCFDLFLAAIRFQTAALPHLAKQPGPAVENERQTSVNAVATPADAKAGVDLAALCNVARDTFLAPLLYAVAPDLAGPEWDEAAGGER